MPDEKATKPDKPERVMGDDPRLRRPEQLPMAALLSMVAGLLGGLSLIVGLMWWLVTKTFGLGPKAFVIIGAVCIIYYLVVNASSIFGSFRQRRLVTAANTVVFAVVIFGVIVLLNVIAVRHPFFRYDSTDSKRFSLSDQTTQIIKSLNEDLKLVAFLAPEDPRSAEVRSRLDDYAALSPRVKVESYDPKIRRDKVQEYNVTSENCIIVVAGDRKETVLNGDEERITSGILAATTGEKTKIYFLTGHGELSADNPQVEIGWIKGELESQQYAVEALTIVNRADPTVPSDAAAVIIAGAQRPIPENEMAALRKYADQGGKLFITLGSGPEAPDFESILKPRGVTPLKGKLIDPDANHNYQAPTVPAVLTPERHQITTQLEFLVLPTARALEIEEGPEPPPSYPGTPPPPPTQKAAPLLKTSAEAWLDVISQDGKGNGTKDGGETTGPLALAAAIDESKKDDAPTPPGMPPPEDDEDAPGTRIVVVADSQFMTGDVIMGYSALANGWFALNAVNWLVSNEKLISIPPKEVDTPYLAMTGAQKAIAAMTTLFIVPGLVVLAGGFVWWRRRR